MTDGSAGSFVAIPAEVLLDDYYANLHGAYNSMREGFATSGLTQDDIAGSLNVDKSLISRRLNGSENLTLKTLSYMGTAMGCRLNISFIPYAMVGVGNSYTYTPSTTFSTTFSTTSGSNLAPISANRSKVLERA
jgi:transcriptional regulator with XRE-family HTH domain